ncbi:MAG: hypothetical protein V3U60_16640 [Gammaproteobacteria bacterium]
MNAVILQFPARSSRRELPGRMREEYRQWDIYLAAYDAWVENRCLETLLARELAFQAFFQAMVRADLGGDAA